MQLGWGGVKGWLFWRVFERLGRGDRERRGDRGGPRKVVRGGKGGGAEMCSQRVNCKRGGQLRNEGNIIAGKRRDWESWLLHSREETIRWKRARIRMLWGIGRSYNSREREDRGPRGSRHLQVQEAGIGDYIEKLGRALVKAVIWGRIIRYKKRTGGSRKRDTDEVTGLNMSGEKTAKGTIQKNCSVK